MSARAPVIPELKVPVATSAFSWRQSLVTYGALLAALIVLHGHLLHLPYFWDEAGYYIPAARDLYLHGSLIPTTTISNAHPPLVMAWLALAWRLAGFSTVVTRIAMLAVAAFALLGVLRLARSVANAQVAWAAVTLIAVYPVFFAQSSLVHLDLAAAAFTFWGLLAYVEDRELAQAAWFSLAALTKETAILAPLALLNWQWATRYARGKWSGDFLAPEIRQTRSFAMLIPLAPLALWYGFHYLKTGYLLGNPGFVQYNLGMTVNPVRIPLALGTRLWQVSGYFGMWLLTAAGLIAMRKSPLQETPSQRISRNYEHAGRPRIALWMQGSFYAVITAYLLFMAVVGGAELARYMLPVMPLFVIVLVSTLWRRMRPWGLIIGGIAIVFLMGWFENPPYTFPFEDNLAYRDFVMLHQDASHFLEMKYLRARVLTAWPASDELNRPWLGYASRPFAVMRIEDFSPAQVQVAVERRDQYDVALVFSTKYYPENAILKNWSWWEGIKEQFFGYHVDLRPEEIASRLGGTVVFREDRRGQWVGVIAKDSATKDTKLH